MDKNHKRNSDRDSKAGNVAIKISKTRGLRTQPKRLKKSAKVNDSLRFTDGSHDSLFEEYLQEKEKKRRVQVNSKPKGQKVKAASSTPVKRLQNKHLVFEVSPIPANLTAENIDVPIDPWAILKANRIHDLENRRKRLESSLSKTSKKLIADIAQRRKKLMPLQEIPNDSIGISRNHSDKHLQEMAITPEKQLKTSSSANSVFKNPDNTCQIKPFRIIPSIVTTFHKETSEENCMLHENHQEPKVSHEISNTTLSIGQLSDSKSALRQNSMIIKPHSSKTIRELTKIDEDRTFKRQTRSNKAADQTIGINNSQMTRKVKFAPETSSLLSFDSFSDATNTHTIRKSTSPFETTSPVKVNLQPGKWRKSLIAWRKHRSSFQKKIDQQPTIHERSVLQEHSDEKNLHASLSIFDASVKSATFLDRKTSQRKTSVLDRSSIFYGLRQDSLLRDEPALIAKQIVLRRCGQSKPLIFDEIYSEGNLPNCCKIGEGVYGEVFMFKCPLTHQPIVLKIIPIEGELSVNGETQKRFDEIIQEIVISTELSGLRNDSTYATEGFVNVKRVTCVQGAYPEHLIDEWELYRDNRVEGSDNDHPESFPSNQLFVVFELCNGGKDLEAFIFNNAAEALSVFLQIALTLSVAEQKFEFEHRDLHWGNILIAPTTEKYASFRLNKKVVKLPTHGVKVTIIDYSLSRMAYDGAVLYDNLARDEELFQSTGDYQFDIYRLMRHQVQNDFERFEPYTNVLWLHYIIDKLINGARYRCSKTKKHRAAINELMQERDVILNYTSSKTYVDHLDLY